MRACAVGSWRNAAVACLVGVAVAVALAQPAAATFPGQAGKIAFTDSAVRTAYENGGGVSALTPPMDASEPEWSADGQRLVFAAIPPGESQRELWVVDVGGSGLTQLTKDSRSINPSWSPDGTKVTFERESGIYVMNSDGTGATSIASGVDPSWSPDGSKIAYATSHGYGSDIRLVNPDGTGDGLLIAPPAGAGYKEPDWSPDGTKVAFQSIAPPSSSEIHIVGSDGGGHVNLTPSGFLENPGWSPDGYFILANTESTIRKLSSGGGFNAALPIAGNDPAWQPIPGITGYPRPLAASPVSVSLVPAYQQCGEENMSHGPPLAERSCGPPAQASATLTVGTWDSNGHAPKSIGRLRLRAMVGNPATGLDEADVAVYVEITDVRRTTSLTDYDGELRLEASLRLVDKGNSGAPPSGTMTDTTIGFTIPCEATADTGIGGRCGVETTIDSLVPGAVDEGARAIWELGLADVFDGGADGDAETPADNALFMRPGIFVP